MVFRGFNQSIGKAQMSEALETVLGDIRSKIQSLESEIAWYSKRLKENELLLIANKELIANLESPSWSNQALHVSNGSVCAIKNERWWNVFYKWLGIRK